MSFVAFADVFKTMLKEIVDETSFGKYDFMYLRIGKKPYEIFEFIIKLTSRF